MDIIMVNLSNTLRIPIVIFSSALHLPLLITPPVVGVSSPCVCSLYSVWHQWNWPQYSITCSKYCPEKNYQNVRVDVMIKTWTRPTAVLLRLSTQLLLGALACVQGRSVKNCASVRIWKETNLPNPENQEKDTLGRRNWC